MSDRALWAWRVERRRQHFLEICSTRLTYLTAEFWGIDIAPGCRFVGRPLLRLATRSKMNIGADGVYRSAQWSNQAGLERPCFLSTLEPDALLSIGRACGFSGTVVAAAEEVVIGDRVLCGANATITDSDWHGAKPGTRQLRGDTAPVRLEDDVWIGMNAIVLKGVTIGKGTVVGAGSVVTRSLPEGVVAAGNPARVIGHFD